MKTTLLHPVPHLLRCVLLLAALVTSLAGSARAQDIPDALDAPSLPWTDAGIAAWLGQTTNTHDGVDAGRSGIITHSEDSAVETFVNGPGTISFWWRVSSELNWDYLEFFTNGVLQGRISGTGGAWASKTLNLPESAAYTLRWQYRKDGSVSAGQDAAYLDQVTFVPDAGAPLITQQPQNRIIEEGQSATFTVAASGAPPLTYQWRKNNADIVGANGSAHSISPAVPTDAAGYTVVVQNFEGSVTSVVATLTVSPLYSIEDALDEPDIIFWDTSFSSPWQGQGVVTHDGLDAARSGAIPDLEETWVETAVAGPGYITYWWKVSSEANYDYLEFLINGVVQSSRISGEVDWAFRSNNIPDEGQVTLRWRYRKDGSVVVGQDRAWLDQMDYVYTPLVPPAVTDQPLAQTVPCGGVATFTVGSTGVVLNSQWTFNGAEIPGATNSSLVLSNVGPSQAGNYAVTICNTVGCATSSNAVLAVSPNLALTLTCPGNLTATTETPAGAAVSYSVIANTQCDPTAAVACLPPSGSVFPLGTTPVSCTATNGAGQMRTCGFSVRVLLCQINTLVVEEALPDNNIDGILSTMIVSSPIGALTDVNVHLVVTGTYNGDLYAVLTHGSGQAVLLNRVGRTNSTAFGYSDPGLNIRLDDQAPNGDVHIYRLTLNGSHAVRLGGPLTGDWAPDGRATSPTTVATPDPRTQLLESFNGLDPNGEWTLQIADAGLSDAHRVVSWSLELCGEQAGPPPAFRIVGTQYDGGASAFTLTWESQPGAVYAVEASADLSSPSNWIQIANPVNSQGATTSYSEIPLPTQPRYRFYRVRKF